MKWTAAILVAFAALAAAPSSFADAIDGEWCSAKGEELQIEGPRIRLPSGAFINGQYRRHTFAYQVPANEPDAGVIIYMEQLSEEMMNLYRIKDGEPGPAEPWRRCNVTS